MRVLYLLLLSSTQVHFSGAFVCNVRTHAAAGSSGQKSPASLRRLSSPYHDAYLFNENDRAGNIVPASRNDRSYQWEWPPAGAIVKQAPSYPRRMAREVSLVQAEETYSNRPNRPVLAPAYPYNYEHEEPSSRGVIYPIHDVRRRSQYRSFRRGEFGFGDRGMMENVSREGNVTFDSYGRQTVPYNVMFPDERMMRRDRR